jgi:hypothetical protein
VRADEIIFLKLPIKWVERQAAKNAEFRINRKNHLFVFLAAFPWRPWRLGVRLPGATPQEYPWPTLVAE